MYKRKLQVFISSTYSDLREERQAAVEAILTAGHIPAGLELFAAGDESQMNVIKRWIDESDVYMLILGGRYGSLEPKTRKSYIQLEYEYAVKLGKPLFSIVIDEKSLEKKIKRNGASVIEIEHPDQLKEFRKQVCTKVVRFWNDQKDIKLAILETLADFNNRTELTGWIPGNETINLGSVVEEIARLTKENSLLSEKIASMASDRKTTTYNGLEFTELQNLLNSREIVFTEGLDLRELKGVAKSFGDKKPTLLHYLWIFSRKMDQEGINCDDNNTKLLDFGLVKFKKRSNGLFESDVFTATPDAKQFLMRLRAERNLSEAEKYIK